MAEIQTPILHVTMRDGSDYVVESESPDMVYFDLERQKRKWPSIQEGPFVWLHYLAWSASKREGRVNGASFDNWLPTVRRVVNVDADGQETEESAVADPTPPGLAPDSS